MFIEDFDSDRAVICLPRSLETSGNRAITRGWWAQWWAHLKTRLRTGQGWLPRRWVPSASYHGWVPTRFGTSIPPIGGRLVAA